MRRLDRSVALGWHSLTDRVPPRAIARVPVLMYHSVSCDTRPGHPYFETHTFPQIFRSHLQYLRSRGYTAVDVNQIEREIASGACGRIVALTFDDGFADFYSNALPLLIEFGFTATLYLVSSLSEKGRSTFHGKELMTWNEIREVQNHRISIGSHSMTHPEFYSMTPAAIERELRASKTVIEDKLGAAVDSFAYPFAFPEPDRRFIRSFRGLLQGAGYRNGVTTSIGRASAEHDKFFYPRLPVSSWDDLLLLEAKLAGSYDWMHLPQYLCKLVKVLQKNVVSLSRS